MSFSPVPKYSFNKLTDVSSDFLKDIGVSFLMLDLDNTIAPYGVKSPSGDILRWSEDMKKNGIELYIVSNNRQKGRVEAFSKALDIGYIKGARKPSPEGVRRSMNSAGYRAGESALAGDQVYTDVLAANLADIISIAVPPINMKNPALALRYAFELPFRALCKNRKGRGV